MNKDELVDQVKIWQRTSKGHKQAWDRYVKEAGADKSLDPKAKDESFLQQFLDATEMGMISTDFDEGEWNARMMGKGKDGKKGGGGKGYGSADAGNGEVSEDLAQQVKDWQRISKGHALAWANFCKEHYSPGLDPKSKSNAFLQGFLDATDQGWIVPEHVEDEGKDGKDGKDGKKATDPIAAAWEPDDGDREAMLGYMVQGVAAMIETGTKSFGEGFMKLVEMKGIGKGIPRYVKKTSGGKGYDDRPRPGKGNGWPPPAFGKGKPTDMRGGWEKGARSSPYW